MMISISDHKEVIEVEEEVGHQITILRDPMVAAIIHPTEDTTNSTMNTTTVAQNTAVDLACTEDHHLILTSAMISEVKDLQEEASEEVVVEIEVEATVR